MDSVVLGSRDAEWLRVFELSRFSTPRRAGRLFALALSLCVAATVGAAQTPGDLLVAGTSVTQRGQILSIRKSDGAIATLFQSRGFPEIVQSVVMGEDNRAWFVALQRTLTRGGDLLRVTSATQWTTIRRFSDGDGPQAMTIDHDGSLLVATAGGRLLQITPSGATTTVYSGSVLLNAVALDPVSGHALVAEFTGGPARLLLVDTARRVVLGTQPTALVRAMAPAPRLGGVLIGTPATGVGLWRNGAVSVFTTVSMGNALLASEGGPVFGAGGMPPMQAVYQVDTRGALLGSVDLSASMLVIRHLQTQGSHALWGRGPVRAGAWFDLELVSGDPTDAGRPYIVLPSLGTHPGFGLGPGKFLAVNPDLLTELSLRGALTSILEGTSGALDSRASARLRLRVSTGLTGVRVYLAGVVLRLEAPWPDTFHTLTNTVVVVYP